MLFNFLAFVEELRKKEDKKEVVEKYEKHFWPVSGTIQDQIWYKEYLINFATIPFRVPKELKNEFDWDLLQKLVAASFSSECVFEKPSSDVETAPSNDEENPVMRDFIISVKSGDQSVVKRVEELWSFQILRLYEIYIEEQMNLQVLMKEDEKEKSAILGQRQGRLQRWKLVIDSLDKEELEKQAAAEKEEKLSDLYSQL